MTSVFPIVIVNCYKHHTIINMNVTKMSEAPRNIKHDFRQRFGREPPTKNTLLVWERKLFATGSVHDAPRSGRPVNRRRRVAEVAASLRAAPALSLRARAAALRLPRTTLRTILRRDLRHDPRRDPPTTLTGKHQTKKIVKKPVRRKLKPQASNIEGVSAPHISPVTSRDTYT